MALGLGLLGLAGAGKQVGQFQLWLAKGEGPDAAKAMALAPIIDCMNRVDRDWRLAYYAYTTKQWLKPTIEQILAEPVDRWGTRQAEFGDRNEVDGRHVQNDICAPRISDRLQRLEPDNPMVGAVGRYVQALQDVTPLTDVFDFYQNISPNVFVGDAVADAMPRKGDAYMAASTELRQRLEAEDLRLRPGQLAQLETRFGRDTHWHLLNYMLAARTAVNQIEQGVRQANLTPQTLGALTDAVQQAALDATEYRRLHPARPQAEFAGYLWGTITPSADAYLTALHTLHRDWLAHAPAQQLSDDFYQVTRRYDALLSYYNKLARSEF